MNAIIDAGRRYMPRQKPEGRRVNWRQKLTIHSHDGDYKFYVDFGEYRDGRLAEIFITAHKTGTFVRGILDTLARSVSLALQSGTSPHDMAEHLLGQDYPPNGRVTAVGSTVRVCKSLADYIGREIVASYDADGRRIQSDNMADDGEDTPTDATNVVTAEDVPVNGVVENPAVYLTETWRSGA